MIYIQVKIIQVTGLHECVEIKCILHMDLIMRADALPDTNTETESQSKKLWQKQNWQAALMSYDMSQ